jgi:hypothetical protein
LSPRQGATDNNPAFQRWVSGPKHIQSPGRGFNRNSRDQIPALKRWAISCRPLRGLTTHPPLSGLNHPTPYAEIKTGSMAIFFCQNLQISKPPTAVEFATPQKIFRARK